MKRHLLSAGDLTRDDAELVLQTAEELRSLADRPIKKLPALRGRTVVNLFFEDSTRTRISFEAAAKRLSADVINFAAKGSSLSKGESLKDTALTLEAMGADAVVVRHSASGAPHRLANSGWVRSSVVNAGDGTHEHPTQALLDAFTMWRHLASRTAAASTAAGSRSSATSCTAGSPAPTRCCCARSAPRSRWSRRRRCCRSGVETLAGRDVVRPRRGDPEGRRGDDAARPARADERLVLPDRRASTPAATASTAGGWRRCRTTRSSCTPARWSAAWRSPPTWPTRDRSVIVEQVTNGVAVRMAVLYLLLGGSEPAVGGEE